MQRLKVRVMTTGTRLEQTPWVDGRVPDGFWGLIRNRRRYMRWLGALKNFRRNEDWYRIRKRDFHENGGGGLLANYYNDSPYAALLEYKPHYDWKPWLFGSTPQGYWQKPENRRAFMDWLGKRLGFQKTSDWYGVTKRAFYQNGGGGLLANHYGDSPFAAVKEYRPRYPWKEWLFRSVPQGYWQAPENRRAYLAWLGKELGWKTAEDWSQLSRKHFLKHGGGGLLTTHYQSSPLRALKEAGLARRRSSGKVRRGSTTR